MTLPAGVAPRLYVEDGNGLTVWGVTIATSANTKNTDGIDIDSLTNATVFGCYIEDGDDGVAIKTNSGVSRPGAVRSRSPLLYWSRSSVVKFPTEFGVDLSRVVKMESSKGQAVLKGRNR